MPRISAETVIEHRATREQQIVEAATRLIQQNGVGSFTINAVALEVGLTRTAIYKYFTSTEDLRRRIVRDSFTAWGEEVAQRVDAAGTPIAQVHAYTDATLALAKVGAHRTAIAAGVGQPDIDASLTGLHADLREPLVEALRGLSTSEPTIEAELIDGMLGRAISLIDNGHDANQVTRVTKQFIHNAIPTCAEGANDQ